MSQEPDEDLPDEVSADSAAPWALPWMLGDILAVFFLWIFWPSLLAALLLTSNALTWILPDTAYLSRTLNPEERKTAQEALGLTAGPVAAKVTEPDYTALVSTRLGLWAHFLAGPLQIVTFPLWFFWRHRTPPADYGLTARGWPRGVSLGLLSALVLIPGVLLFYQAVVFLYGVLIKVPTEEHPLALLTRQELFPIEWVFWVGLAVILAPVMEEILFRGIVQDYLLAHSIGGYAIVAGALLIVVAGNSQAIQAVRDTPGWDKLDAFMPVLFILLLALGYLATREYGSQQLQAVFAGSILFAAVHPTWPHPIPLFVLGMGLGYLRVWSGSLVAPILVHALFNGTSTVLYFWLGV
jgi:membrane protease YdiL (CAAX protease family)